MMKTAPFIYLSVILVVTGNSICTAFVGGSRAANTWLPVTSLLSSVAHQEVVEIDEEAIQFEQRKAQRGSRPTTTKRPPRTLFPINLLTCTSQSGIIFKESPTTLLAMNCSSVLLPRENYLLGSLKTSSILPSKRLWCQISSEPSQRPFRGTNRGGRLYHMITCWSKMPLE